MDVAYEILIDGLKKYGAEVIAAVLAFVTFWLWRRYQKNIISGLKFAVMVVLAVIAACGVYAAASWLGGAFLLGFAAASVIWGAVCGVYRFRSGKQADLFAGIPITILQHVEYGIAGLYYDGYFEQSKGETIIQELAHDNTTYYMWMERAAEHGYSHAQNSVANHYAEEYDNAQAYTQAYIWGYIGKLCSDYVESLSDLDMEIRRKIDWHSHWQTISDLKRWPYFRDYAEGLSGQQIAALEREAKAKFAKIKKFMDAQIKAYKAEHS